MIHRRINIISAALLLTLIPPNARTEGYSFTWHPAGYGGGGRFTAVAVDPSDPQIVYIGSDVAGLFRSKDGGNHYTSTGKGLEGFAVADIAVNPALPHQVVALTDDGLYVSMDQGGMWVRISGDITYPSRFFGSRLLLFTRNSLWVGSLSKGVCKVALDRFQSPPVPVPGLEGKKVNGLTVYDGYLFAGTNLGVYRLEERNWKLHNKGLPQVSAEVTDIASAGIALYMVEKSRGLFRWNPQYETWEHRPVSSRPQPKGYKSVWVHPNHPEMVFIGSHPENWPHLLFKTQDGGSTWKSLTSFQTDSEAPRNWTHTLSGIEKIGFVPRTAHTLFMTDWWNVWKTTDAGEHWIQKHQGLQNTVVNDVKIHPRNPNMLYLCTADNGLMISEDAGKNWQRKMKGVADGHAQEIEISRTDPDRMVLLMNPWHKKGKIHVYESRDQGTTWKDIGFPVPADTLPKLGYVDGLATNLELDPFSENTIYVGTNGYGVYKSTDAGKSWFPMNQGLTTPFIKGPGALKTHPQSRDILFAATQGGGIFKSTDGTKSWQRMTTGSRFVFGMAIDPSTPSRIVAGCAGNSLLVSQDEGKNWQEIRLPIDTPPQMAVFSVAFHPKVKELVLAGTIRYDVKATEGVFISMDHATTFRPVPMDIPRVNANTITWTAANKSSAYVGFNGTGIFRLDMEEKGIN